MIQRTAQHSLKQAHRSFHHFVDFIYLRPQTNPIGTAMRTAAIWSEIERKSTRAPGAKTAFVTTIYSRMDKLFDEVAMDAGQVPSAFFAAWHRQHYAIYIANR